jgi:hypothetical protein
MTNDEIKIMIDNYFDDELEKSKEPILFSALSSDIEARDYFKKLHVLGTIVKESTEPFPAYLEEKILTSVKPVKSRLYKNINFRSRISNIISIAAASALFIICSLLFFDIKDYKLKINIITEQVKEQNETMNLILNSNLPAFVISPDAKNEIIVRAKSQ